MSVMQFIADVHGAHDLLKEKLDHTLPLAVLGDNLNLVDFRNLSGVAARVLTPADIGRILLALSTGGPKKAMELANDLFFQNPERVAAAQIEISKDYRQLAEVLPLDALVLHGNVDYPELLSAAIGLRWIEAETRSIDGVKVGFLSGTGSYPYSMHLPGEISDGQYTEKLWSLGNVDVLCTHFPPAVDGLTWDVVAKRDEGGGAMLTDYLRQVKPKLHLFGHIHNPKISELRFESTLLKNVGGFRYHGQVHQIDLERIGI